MDLTTAARGESPRRSLVPAVRTARSRALTQLAKAEPAALLIGRLSVGLLFLSTGWGKVHDLAHVTEFFQSLHIPLPAFHAVLVGYSELLCGAAISVGLLTRLATLPLIVSMFVAILTARLGDVAGVLDLVALEEFTYLALLAMLLILGPGRASIDRWLERALAA